MGSESVMRRESGFTLIEVLIAAMLVVAVGSGAVYAFAGAGRTQQSSKVRQQMAAAADSLGQRIRADRDWLRDNPACRTNFAQGCDLTQAFPLPPARGRDARLVAQIVVRPVDSQADKTGVDDEDNVVPDVYRVEIQVRMAPREEERFGRVPPLETLTSVDPTSLGLATGSLVVQTCFAENQVDERMAISGCSSASDQRKMGRQPEPCVAATRPDQIQAYSCNSAFDAAFGKNTLFGTVSVVAGPPGIRFTLQRQGGNGGPVVARHSADADSVDAKGSYVFSGLPSGVYRIMVDARSLGNQREVWATHNIPDNLRASVQSNQQSRALIMTRPRQGASEYDVKMTRTVYLYRLATSTHREVDTFSVFGQTIRTTTTYTYLYGVGPVRQRWGGPAWNGHLGMEPKPYDRYRNGTRAVHQPYMLVPWRNIDDPRPLTFTQMPTGLAAVPEQIPAPTPVPDDYWGSFGQRSTHHTCPAPAGGAGCGDFVWLHPDGPQFGGANGYTSFHSEDGECMLESRIPGYSFPRRLQLGGAHSNRCSRDYYHGGGWIRDFLPDKDGRNGKRVIWKIDAVTENLSRGGVARLNLAPASGSRTVAAGSASPPRPRINPPKLVVVGPRPAPTRSDPTPAAPKMAMPAVALPRASTGSAING